MKHIETGKGIEKGILPVTLHKSARYGVECETTNDVLGRQLKEPVMSICKELLSPCVWRKQRKLYKHPGAEIWASVFANAKRNHFFITENVLAERE